MIHPDCVTGQRELCWYSVTFHPTSWLYANGDVEIAHTQTVINICTEYMQTDDTKAVGDNNNHKIMRPCSQRADEPTLTC